MDVTTVWLTILAFGAALINGGIGYGFSSIVTPVAIFWYSNKVLNPAIVLVELSVNLALLVRERAAVRATWPRARPVLLTLFPGVVLGTFGLALLAVNDVKVVVYATLFPLVALQLLGVGRPIRGEKRAGAALGPGIGFLYALTTISGPPLALFLRNQGLAKEEFRATIAQIRLAESALTLGTYLAFDSLFSANLFTVPSLNLLPYLVVPVLLGVPLGALVLRGISPEVFRRVVMAVDGVFVAYGLSRVLVSERWLSTGVGYATMGLLCVAVVTLAVVALRAAPGPGAKASPGFTEPPG